MLGKLALTLVVIVIAALYIRHRARAQRVTNRDAERARQPASHNPWHRNTDNRQSRDIPPGKARHRLPADTGKILLWITLAIIVTTGASLYYLAWRDARQPVTVILHSGNGEPVTYEVRKRDLDARAFTTLDGTRVTVADSERMEVIGL
ncbi:MAG: hypothetical protein WEB57_06630 [Pseudohongiellaceae bacterium]